MGYGYKTNKEFIDKSYQLLNELDKKGVWNKDTLIVGLDKSVRPLAYTIRKLSKEEERETPDIRFFNYSVHDNIKGEKVLPYLEGLKNPATNEKLLTEKNLSKYKKVLILDDDFSSGKTLKRAEAISKEYFSKLKKNPKTYLATLRTVGLPNNENKKIIFVQDFMPDPQVYDPKIGNGVEDYYGNEIVESIRIKNKKIYAKFSQNRTQLREEIIKYVKEKHPKKEKVNFLEKIVKLFSLFLIIMGGLIGPLKITGNVIGNSSFANPIGIVLILFGIVGFIFSIKFKK